jgi:hypothetical protein
MTDHLDGLLNAWADRQRLDDAAAATMLQSILETPPVPVAVTADPAGLPPTWWADFGSRFSDAMLRATGVLVPTAA